MIATPMRGGRWQVAFPAGNQFIPHIPLMHAGPPQRCSAGVGHASGAALPDCAEKVEYTFSIEWLPQSHASGSGLDPMTKASKRVEQSPHSYS